MKSGFWGGLPWSIIEVNKRDVYMKALEEASVTQNIGTFAKFVYGICSHEHSKILTSPLSFIIKYRMVYIPVEFIIFHDII